MEARELRIGNLILFDNILMTVTIISSNKLVCTQGVIPPEIFDSLESEFDFPIEKFNPIPITKEWLLKFGFERDKGVGIERSRIVLTLFDLEFHTGKIWIRTATSVIQIDHIKYVHQVQNLYFALTGEELTIKK